MAFAELIRPHMPVLVRLAARLRALRVEGERWRAHAPDTVRVDATLFLRRQTGWPSRLATIAAAAVVGMVALVAAPQLLSRPPSNVASTAVAVSNATATPKASVGGATSTPPATASATEETVAEGDAVVGVGYLHDGEPYAMLCRLVLVAGMGEGVCVGPTVRVLGLDPSQRELIGSYVSVTGVWNAGALVADSITAIEKPSPKLPVLPCDQPPSGWPATGPPLEHEDAARRVEEYISARPHTYAGFWAAAIPGRDDLALVVATVIEPAAADAELRRAIDVDLCVQQVEFSGMQLETVANRLRSEHPSWQVAIDASANRVRVALPVLDARTADLLRPDSARISVEPLVRLR